MKHNTPWVAFLWFEGISTAAWLFLLGMDIKHGMIDMERFLIGTVGWLGTTGLLMFIVWAMDEAMEMSMLNRFTDGIPTPEDRKHVDKRSQQRVNDELTHAAKMEGREMYEQWESGHLILIPRPRTSFIMVYDDETALTNDDYNRIRQEEFNKLKTKKL